jgi:hypothetical protein
VVVLPKISEKQDDVKVFLPAARQGAILFTTCLHALEGLAHMLELATFTRTEALAFLVSRANLADPAIPPDTLPGEVLVAATALVEATDGLPLALDQAGAYIERTGCRLAEYLQLFQYHQGRLLAARSPNPSSVKLGDEHGKGS